MILVSWTGSFSKGTIFFPQILLITLMLITSFSDRLLLDLQIQIFDGTKIDLVMLLIQSDLVSILLYLNFNTTKKCLDNRIAFTAEKAFSPKP